MISLCSQNVPLTLYTGIVNDGLQIIDKQIYIHSPSNLGVGIFCSRSKKMISYLQRYYQKIFKPPQADIRRMLLSVVDHARDCLK